MYNKNEQIAVYKKEKRMLHNKKMHNKNKKSDCNYNLNLLDLVNLFLKQKTL